MNALARRVAEIADAVHEANKRTLDPVTIELRDSICQSNRVSRSAISRNEWESSRTRPERCGG
ncbi:hypothetical protein MAHJHV65_45150 [Mycobacterium avium subsp. hominissuis]